ncbi:hypothetical protein Q8F55_000576 [Vanrija albida]|uniref:Amidohydrolase-related domain-containing protein n=1 Tax=Vanrija albida TaxID=181172 RepID=A0ABR3QDV2_9TREE
MQLLPALAVKPWLAPPSEEYYLTNARVVDAGAGRLLDGLRAITVRDGHIVAVEPVDAPLDPGVRVHDLAGAYLCPGLIDAHVHVTAVPGVQTMAALVNVPDQLVTLRSIYVLRGMLARGFTTVRDTGGATKFLADAIAEGLVPGPRLYQCGQALSQTGGHGDFVSGAGKSTCCGGHSACLGRVADGVPAVLRAVREELKQGADFIKVMLGGGVASESDAIETVQFLPEEVRAITATAWQMGRKMVTAHAYTVEAIRHAIDNGVRGIEHGNLIDEDTAKLMAEKDIFLTPTLSCYGIMVRAPFEDFLNEDGRGKSAEVMQQGLNALKIAEDAGVTVCYGSDLLISMHALQTGKHATVNPARMLGQAGRLGVVAPGAVADLLVLRANPLEDITVLDRPEEYLQAVVKEGRVVSGALVNPHRLPAEVWHMVINDHLDVETDRSTLPALLRVSSTLWYEAARLLYCNIDISGDKMAKLLLSSTNNPLAYLARPKRAHSACCHTKEKNFLALTLTKPLDPKEILDQAELDTLTLTKPLDQTNDFIWAFGDTVHSPDVSPRTRQALSFIQRLSLRDLTVRHLNLMLAMAIPGDILFPNVFKLHVHSISNPFEWYQDKERRDRYSFCPRTALFGAIHLCAWGAFAPLMASVLPARKYLTVNLHNEHMNIILADWFSRVQEPWDKSSRVYWFVKEVNHHSKLPEHHLRPAGYPHLPQRAPPARCLVGSCDDGSSAPKIPSGDWDESETSEHQFRMDSGEHTACVVCNAKMEFGDRTFGCSFTTSL